MANSRNYNFNVPVSVDLGISNSLLILLLTGLYCVLAIWMVLPAPPAGFWWDDAWYLMMAEWLSGRPEHQELAWNMLEIRQYPPIWPFVLTLSGATLQNQHLAYIMNALFLGLGAGVAMAWFIREGFSTLATVLAAAILMFNPLSLFWLPTLFSEHLYILLTTLALVLASVKRDSIPLWLVIGILAGLSAATRSTGWALVPAILIALVLQRRFTPLLPFLFGLAIGALSIPYFKAGLPPSNRYLSLFVTNPGWDFMVEQIEALIAGWLRLWGSWLGALTAAAVVLPGLVIRLRRYCPDAWYVLVYFGMLMVWPFPEHMPRFLWPLLPAFLLAGHSAVTTFKSGKHTPVIAGVVFGLIFVASIPGGIGKSLDRLLDPPDGDLFELSRMPTWTRSANRQIGAEILEVRLQIMRDMERISQQMQSNDCIHSEIGAVVAVQTEHFALAANWKNLDAFNVADVRCPFYYMIPEAMEGVETADVGRFATVHHEFFRSSASWDPEGLKILAAFFELQLGENTQN